MQSRKQVMDVRSNTEGISPMESNEQQRNWTDKHWQNKANDSLANYDPTRAHLNFEVTKGGIVQPIDTSKSISQKMAEILSSRGIKDPNARENLRRRQRTIAQFIFGGNRERMHEIAFGNQAVDLTKSSDNGHITRSKDIEDWAVDVYNFVAKRFGEDNIVSFYVHLDEANPHVHCTLVPINEETNRISWKAVFGDGIEEESENMRKLHDALEEEVSRKWGLERGSDKEETKAKHRSTEEYRRSLVNEVQSLETTREGLLIQVRTAERKLKSLSTMMSNLQTRKEAVQDEIDRISEQFADGTKNDPELAAKLKMLRNRLDGIDSKMAERQAMLDETNRLLEAAREKLAEMNREHSYLQDKLGDDYDAQATRHERNMLSGYVQAVDRSLEPLLPTLTPQQQEILEKSGYYDLTDEPSNVMNCALLLGINYIREATAYAQSCGGSGNPGTGWGRAKDDDDDRWWLKCITKAAEITKPSGSRVKRSR